MFQRYIITLYKQCRYLSSEIENVDQTPVYLRFRQTLLMCLKQQCTECMANGRREMTPRGRCVLNAWAAISKSLVEKSFQTVLNFQCNWWHRRRLEF
ncbi:hypothetical protein PR048_004157 [Dryococelus australis]|uniref:Uncharacterized protein n=1 Tax=Dryococelus australis TaxID=614101 RepID=A0ABQ9I4R3_9NEOP|nr:hypothetical protein PR048_004157 [Dryococelus australis]